MPGPHPSHTGRGVRLSGASASLIVIDAAAAGIAGGLAHELTGGANPSHPSLALTVLAVSAVWLLAVTLHHGFDGGLLGANAAEFAHIGRAAVHLATLAAAAGYLFHADLAPGFVLVALGVTLALDIAGRTVARAVRRRGEEAASGGHGVLAVGDVEDVCVFSETVLRDRGSAIVVRGACVMPDQPGAEALAAAGIPRVGEVEFLVDAARTVGAEAVVVVSPGRLGAERLRSIAWQLEDAGVELLIASGLAEVTERRLRVRSVAGLPLLQVRQPEFRGARRVLKGAFDRLIAGLAVVVLLPVFIGLALVVRLSSPGPAIFVQRRVGRGGREFPMLKFRSMHVDAEAKLAELRDQNVHRVGTLFKLQADPRVTRVGRVLRRYSLDELPQLLNVIAGHMSLVGPRPPLPSEVAAYEPRARRRLLVKPGITGLWQVSGRSDLSWTETLRLDLRYVENWSPALDLLILWRTAAAVIRGSGAY